MHLQLVILVLTGGCALWYVYWRDREIVRRQRAVMFNAVMPHLEGPRLEQDEVGFPVLCGRYRGHECKIEPIADHVGYRKLPSLWLLVTVKVRIPYAGIFDFLARPENIEFYSPAHSLSCRLAIPASWPQYAMLCSDRPQAMPPVQVMASHMHLFEDERVKELLVTPRGVRIVYLANQGRRSHYLVLRSVTFEDLTISADMVRGMLDAALAVHHDLSEEAAYGANSKADIVA